VKLSDYMINVTLLSNHCVLVYSRVCYGTGNFMFISRYMVKARICLVMDLLSGTRETGLN